MSSNDLLGGSNPIYRSGSPRLMIPQNLDGMVHPPRETVISNDPPVTREIPKVEEPVHVVGRTIEPEFVTSDLPSDMPKPGSLFNGAGVIAGDVDAQYEETHMAEVSSVNVVDVSSDGITTTEIPVPLPEVKRTLSAEEEAELGGDDDVPASAPVEAVAPSIPEPEPAPAEELPVTQAEAVESKKKPKKSGRGS